MATKSDTKQSGNKVSTGWVNLKIREGLMERLREHKKKTMVAAGKVADVAITEYLNKQQTKPE